jgi:hypothetical protein
MSIFLYSEVSCLLFISFELHFVPSKDRIVFLLNSANRRITEDKLADFIIYHWEVSRYAVSVAERFISGVVADYRLADFHISNNSGLLIIVKHIV